MSASRRRAFDAAHAGTPMEIVVLTGEHVGGASRKGDEVLWTASAPTIAALDETGALITDAGRLEWLADESERGGWIHDLAPLTQYVVRVRRSGPDPAALAKAGMAVPDLAQHYALDAVIERGVHRHELDERLRRWLEPVQVSTELGEFLLDRSFGWFDGEIAWGAGRAKVTLGHDDDTAERCAQALAHLRAVVTSQPDVDARWRRYAAGELADLANDWQRDEDATAEPITPEAFADRIRLTELSIESDGSMTPYFDDGDLFWGHVIIVSIDDGGTPIDATIAG